MQSICMHVVDSMICIALACNMCIICVGSWARFPNIFTFDVWMCSLIFTYHKCKCAFAWKMDFSSITVASYYRFGMADLVTGWMSGCDMGYIKYEYQCYNNNTDVWIENKWPKSRLKLENVA